MRTGHKPDPAAKGPAILNEADIGSGERSPAQHETDEMIREIPPLPPSGSQGSQQSAGQSGSQQSQKQKQKQERSGS